MASSTKDNELFQTRVAHLQKELSKGEAFLFEMPNDLFYLTGKTISTGILIVDKTKVSLIVDGRYFTACKEIPDLCVFLLKKGVEAQVLKKRNLQILYFDSHQTSFAKAAFWKKIVGKSVKLKPRELILKPLRLVKDKEEIKIMKENAQLLYSCYESLLPLIREGISEKELAAAFKVFGIQKGASDFSFEPIIAFGENTAYPHHRPTDKKLKKGTIVLIDIGLEKNHYQSDMTRVVFFGDVSQELLKLHDVVIGAHAAALKLCKPGVKMKELDLAARKVMRGAHLEKYFTHSLGHGIGLETHEGVRIKFDNADKETTLKPGMVFTVEPGLYIEGKGGIRYEDTLVITPNGYENFFPEKKN